MSSHLDRPASPFVLNKIFDFDDQKMIEQQENNRSNRSNLNRLNEQELISQIIKESNFNKNSTMNYSIKSAQLVRNQTLERNYISKRREIKSQRCPIQERFTYYVTQNKDHIENILNNGFNCTEKAVNLLGNSSYGVHLTKHLDIELEKQFVNKTNSFHCLIVKTLVGKTCLIEPSIRNKQINPNLLADCHLSKEIITQSQTLASRHNNSLIYVYDYSKEASLINPPRNIIPFALIEFELNAPETHLTKSLSSFNLSNLSSEKLKPIRSLNNIESNITFEKTPAWRESYERSGGLIELLTKYLKKNRSSSVSQTMRRSQTVTFSPDSSRIKIKTKSTSCLNGIYSLDSNKASVYNRSLTNKRARSLSSDFSSQSGYLESKRLNLNSTMDDDMDFSTDYSYYSSFSSVFESNSSISSTNKSESSDALKEEDVVYLNDCSGEIYSSQEKQQQQTIKEESQVKEGSQVSQLITSQVMNFSVSPPPLGMKVFHQTPYQYPFVFNPFVFNPYYYAMNPYFYYNYPTNNSSS